MGLLDSMKRVASTIQDAVEEANKAKAEAAAAAAANTPAPDATTVAADVATSNDIKDIVAEVVKDPPKEDQPVDPAPADEPAVDQPAVDAEPAIDPVAEKNAQLNSDLNSIWTTIGDVLTGKKSFADLIADELSLGQTEWAKAQNDKDNPDSVFWGRGQR